MMQPRTFGAETVSLIVEDHLATISLTRPAVLNAMNREMMTGIVEAFEYLSDDKDTWCAVLRGVGRSFCVGADQRERETMSEGDIRRRRRLAPTVFSAARRCPKPVVAQVHGHALGGGFEMVLGCDLIVVEKSARLGLVETSRGAVPGGGGTKLLPLMAGSLVAKEMIFTGKTISGVEAASLGLANHAVEADELNAAVGQLVEAIKRCSPVANAQAKKAIHLNQDLTYDDGLRVEAEMYERVLSSADRLEALTAFQQKRPPNFSGE